jgi:hypothetical protein
LGQKLAEILGYIISGLDEAVTGGIFLLGDGGLELRALHGSVEELIGFIGGVETCSLMSSSCVHPSAEGGGQIWMSAPIVCKGKAKGVSVVACREGGDCQSISFLEDVAGRIGSLIYAAYSCELDIASGEMPSRIRAGFAED